METENSPAVAAAVGQTPPPSAPAGLPVAPDNPPAAPAVDDRDVRAKTCNRELAVLLQKYNCVLVVTSLNIQTGKVIPQVEIIAL